MNSEEALDKLINNSFADEEERKICISIVSGEVRVNRILRSHLKLVSGKSESGKDSLFKIITYTSKEAGDDKMDYEFCNFYDTKKIAPNKIAIDEFNFIRMWLERKDL